MWDLPFLSVSVPLLPPHTPLLSESRCDRVALYCPLQSKGNPRLCHPEASPSPHTDWGLPPRSCSFWRTAFVLTSTASSSQAHRSHMGTSARLGATASPPASQASATARLGKPGTRHLHPAPTLGGSCAPCKFAAEIAENRRSSHSPCSGWRLGMEGGGIRGGAAPATPTLGRGLGSGEVGQPNLTLLSPTSRNSSPRWPNWHPFGQRSGGESQGSWRRVVGWRRRAGANVHAPHFQATPGDTKNSSATLAEHPAGRRPPTPAPHATKEVTLGGRGEAPWRPLPQRLDARPDPWGDGSRAPSAALPGPSPGRWGPLAPPSFLGETGAACAHPHAETEHPRGAEASREVEKPAAATEKSSGPHTGSLAHSRTPQQ